MDKVLIESVDDLKKLRDKLVWKKYPILITMDLYKKRSIPQNDLYWGWYIPHLVKWFADLWIFTESETVHETLKDILLSKRKKNKITKKYRKVTLSTTDLNTKEFKKYLEDIEILAMDRWRIIIPPHDNNFESLFF